MANYDGRETIVRAAKDVLEQPEDEREHCLDGWADSLTIYYADSVRIIADTRNDDAILDEGIYSIDDIGQGLNSILDLYGRIAWFAVRADIRDEMQDMRPDDMIRTNGTTFDPDAE